MMRHQGVQEEYFQPSFSTNTIMAQVTPGDHSSKSVRNYRNVPHYEIQTLSRSPELEFIASTIESTLCRLGFSDPDESFMDRDAARILELFFDHHHYKDVQPGFDEPAQKKGYALLTEVVEEDLSDIPLEDLIRVMASIYRAIQRRTKGGDEYLRFINEGTGD